MMLRFLIISLTISAISCRLKISTDLLTLSVGESRTIQLTIFNEKPGNVSHTTLTFIPEHDDIIEVTPTLVLIGPSNNITSATYNISLVALQAGKSGAIITKDPPDTFSKKPLYVLVHVYRSKILQIVSSTVGWLYFGAWTLGYYPQMYTNYKRKSVVGLNFNYILFGMVGYSAYNIFNSGLYFIPLMQEQYSERYERSIIPVEPNDLFLSSHNVLAIFILILQCFLYERGNQTISTIAKIIVELYIILLVLFIILVYLNILLWLDVLYLCSYIKLCVNITFYIPQIHMNYKRKSTKGWNIGSSALNVSGGVLSISQMLINGYNYVNWKTIVENPTKFGIGIVTVGFNSILIVQHCFVYREK